MDLPPSVVVFAGDAWNRTRPHILAKLDLTSRQRVFTVHYPDPCAYPSAFTDELRSSLASAANLLDTRQAPGVQVVFVIDSARSVEVFREAVRLTLTGVQGGLPVFPNILFLGLDASPADFLIDGAQSFFLAQAWRGASLHAQLLRAAGEMLVLAFIATQTSRMSRERFDCFERTRFGSGGGVFLAATDHYDVPDFAHDSERLQTEVLAAHYLLQISPEARASCASRATLDPESLFHSKRSLSLLEIEASEPILCRAIAESETLEQTAAILGKWAAMTDGNEVPFLGSLELAILRWRTELEGIATNKDGPQLRIPLPDVPLLPPFHRLGLQPRFDGSRESWKRVNGDLASITVL